MSLKLRLPTRSPILMLLSAAGAVAEDNASARVVRTARERGVPRMVGISAGRLVRPCCTGVGCLWRAFKSWRQIFNLPGESASFKLAGRIGKLQTCRANRQVSNLPGESASYKLAATLRSAQGRAATNQRFRRERGG